MKPRPRLRLRYGSFLSSTFLTPSCRHLSTPLIADAVLRLHIPLRIAPSGITPVLAGQRLVGRALPVTHFGSVDLFLEATQLARPGDVVLAADDGCLFVTAERFEGIFAIARAIWQRERHQAEAIVDGETLGESWRLPTISRGEPSKPSYTFREHLRKIKNAIEE